MIEFTPFRAGHLEYLKPQSAQRNEHAYLVSSGGASLLEHPMALTAWHRSVCIGVAGCIPVRPHRAVAWAILSDDAGPYMLTIARKIRRVVAVGPYRRVEMTVAGEHEAGHRFARLLGAKRETPEPMRFYGADGGDEVMYALIRE